uniref:Uncharacterized protein n=1 Tax=Chenopodium quinoa TaxID=63459 RepID=A0A803L383_CHEQI
MVPASTWCPTRFVFSRVPFGEGNRNGQQSLANDDLELRPDQHGDMSGDGLTALVGLSDGGRNINVQGWQTESAFHIALRNSFIETFAAGPSGSGTQMGEVEFADVHRLNDGQVKHSPEAFYAGSFWKVRFQFSFPISVQAFNDEDPQGRRIYYFMQVVNKAAATFAPRASTASKNPAVPGSTLYSVFEIQGYASMLLGGVLSFNLVFPSNEPDIWRLMGMWSIWMFTIPSLRARDCSNKEKEALNYLFLLIPLLNVIIPFFWKSFAVVWSADTVAFFLMYAWKLRWLQKIE